MVPYHYSGLSCLTCIEVFGLRSIFLQGLMTVILCRKYNTVRFTTVADTVGGGEYVVFLLSSGLCPSHTCTRSSGVPVYLKPRQQCESTPKYETFHAPYKQPPLVAVYSELPTWFYASVLRLLRLNHPSINPSSWSRDP